MTPSSNLVRDRTAVNALIAEVAGNAIADANVSETAKVEKKIVRDCLKARGASGSKASCRAIGVSGSRAAWVLHDRRGHSISAEGWPSTSQARESRVAD
jgi:hypothetical protein